MQKSKKDFNTSVHSDRNDQMFENDTIQTIHSAKNIPWKLKNLMLKKESVVEAWGSKLTLKNEVI